MSDGFDRGLEDVYTLRDKGIISRLQLPMRNLLYSRCFLKTNDLKIARSRCNGNIGSLFITWQKLSIARTSAAPDAGTPGDMVERC